MITRCYRIERQRNKRYRSKNYKRDRKPIFKAMLVSVDDMDKFE